MLAADSQLQLERLIDERFEAAAEAFEVTIAKLNEQLAGKDAALQRVQEQLEGSLSLTAPNREFELLVATMRREVAARTDELQRATLREQGLAGTTRAASDGGGRQGKPRRSTVDRSLPKCRHGSVIFKNSWSVRRSNADSGCRGDKQ